ncbi:beta carbonic anhydrase 5, chloroplastic [Apium graveolens]|uniref:beta carbonic anhydrase 5, chloroplastic n=1 Tax=Apium graveolens TaxID=4045 RepID=UPI003D7BA85F
MDNAVGSSSLLKSSTQFTTNQAKSSSIFGNKLNFSERKLTHFRKAICFRNNPTLSLKASMDSPRVTQELADTKQSNTTGTQNGNDLFNEMKHRFLSFKRHKYQENLEHFQNLAKSQAPKVLVIACADSRVCPSNILGFQPGDAFVVRNVANLVPPFETGPTETKAALEFSVNTLEVENILVVGHSCCGGIRALMGMPDEDNSRSFIRSWVVTGKNAKLNTKAAASNLSFDLQCKHCEKESVNLSLLNLISYPWIEERVSKGLLSIHGGYYDFVNCTFEKWSLDYKATSSKKESDGYSLVSREFWS